MEAVASYCIFVITPFFVTVNADSALIMLLVVMATNHEVCMWEMVAHTK